MIEHKIVSGSGGGGGGGRKPKEQPNTLQANTRANIVDVLCEGLIEGPANGAIGDTTNEKWLKSTYFNETVVMSSDGSNTLNFEGVEIDPKNGDSESTFTLGHFEPIDNITVVSTELLKDTGPYVFTINDLEVDSVYVTIEIPALLEQTDKGDINKTTVKIHIDVIGDNGAGDTGHPITADGAGKIYGKNTSPYRVQYYIPNLFENYGVGPWVVKVYRDTNDSTSAKKQNRTYVYSYTQSKEVKMIYPDTALVGISLDSSKFGDTVPSRAYKIRGLKIKYPSNYTPDKDNGGGTYSGIWNGNFVTGYCTNPAWVLYDLLTNVRYGLGEYIDTDYIDKWTLYTIGQYCDESVDFIERRRTPGGTYTDSTATEPRFTFNGPISSRDQALVVINHICSVFRGYPIWGSGYVSFVQDSPKDITRIANNANVKDGYFEYTDTQIQNRTTAAKVSYTNLDMFGKPDIVLIQNDELIQTYGYNPTDISCFGCTSRSEAIRRAKYILSTDLNQSEFVKFVGGIEWADALPGEIIGIQDKDYTSSDLSGRIKAATTTSITVDRSVTIAAGVTYTLYIVSNDAASVIEKTLTNSPGATTVLTWSGAITKPNVELVWALTKSTVLDVRKFQIVGVKEANNGTEYEIEALYYNENKYDEVELGFTTEVPPSTNLPVGKLDPPSNVQGEPYTYTEGDQDNRKYGVLISWTASPDVRTIDYEIQVSSSEGSPETIGDTGETSFDWRNVTPDTYLLKVRARGVTGYSNWALYPGLVVDGVTVNMQPPQNLRTVDDPDNDQFHGPDCEIEWDPSPGSSFDGTNAVGYDTVAGYQVKVYKVDDTLLRTYNTADSMELEYTYTFNMNYDDNDGSPVRQIKFHVFTFDRYGELSDPAILVASNPAPDMSSTLPVVTPKFNYLKITWAEVSDNDMDYYNIYCDTNSSPTTFVGTIKHPGNIYEVFDVLYGTEYYVKIVPYDLFGVGTASQIPDPESPLQIPGINVDAEVQNSITITYSDSTNYSGDILDVYDGKFSTGGITFTPASEEYLNYEYKIENYFDRVGIWTGNANAKVYIGLSTDNSSWTYLTGEADHTLDSTFALVATTNKTTAATNYWQLVSGFNIALFPDNLTAKYVRIYFVNTNSTVIYEAVPSRILISELAAIQHLSSISADIGTIIAGSLQTQNYGSSAGALIDLDSEIIRFGGSSDPIFEWDGDAETLTMKSDDGKTVWDDNVITVTDTASVVRVKLGKLS